MDTIRRELVSETAIELFEYLKATYCIEADIADMQSIIDSHVGYAIDAAYEKDCDEED